MKLTKKQINKIKELKEKGSTAKEISIELKIPTSTVQYHYDENNKNRQIKYQQEYQKKILQLEEIDIEIIKGNIKEQDIGN